MSATPAWVALDWGTTHLRGWAMSAGDRMLAEARSGDGVAGLTPDGFEPALLRLIADWEIPARLPVLACGMVGARQGWAETPYAPVPASPSGRAATAAPTRDTRLSVGILPGLSQTDPPDVMRGEETQIAGHLAADPGYDGVLLLPGTHSKWAEISAGEVVSFRTAITGELFGLLAERSVLRDGIGAGWDGDAFAEAVSDALSRPEALSARLFALRAAALLESLSPDTARARLSGLLIGAELAATRPYWLGRQVAILGETTLASRYAEALATLGVTATILDARTATLRGLVAARHRQERPK